MALFGMIIPTVAVILLVIALLIFGPGKLPQVAKGIGKSIKDFKSEVNMDSESSTASSDAESKEQKA